MPTIRIPDEHWGKVWRFLIENGPISRISKEHIYIISEEQLRLLKKKKFPFDLVPRPNGPVGKNKNG